MTEGATDMEVDGNSVGASGTQTAEQQPSQSGLQPRPSEGTDTPATPSNGSGGSASDGPTPAIVGGTGDTTTNVNGAPSPTPVVVRRKKPTTKDQFKYRTEDDDRVLVMTYADKTSEVVLKMNTLGTGLKTAEVVSGPIYMEKVVMSQENLKGFHLGLFNLLRGAAIFIRNYCPSVYTVRIGAGELGNGPTQFFGRKFHPALISPTSSSLFLPASHRFPSPTIHHLLQRRLD